MTVQSIGFVGLGMMGSPMAKRIREAGHRLFVSDADAAKTLEYCEKNEALPLDADAVAGLDVLITMLPNSNIVEQVVLGENGLAKSLRSGATIIDMSSSEPARSKALGKTLAQQEIQYLDAPVSGGVKRAVEGSLAILVGGEALVLNQHRGLLALLGAKILHVGGAGAGHAAKALNNYVSAAGLVATVEALQIGQRFGIDPGVLTDVLNASSGQTNTSLNKVRQFMLSGTFGSGFALQLMAKDLGIAAGLAEAVDYDMELGNVCVGMWKQVGAQVTPATDHTEMYRLLSKP